MRHHPTNVTTDCECLECDAEVTYLPELDADEDGEFEVHPSPVLCAACAEHCCEADREFCGRNGCVHCGEARATTEDQHANPSCEACAAKERAA